MKNELEKRYSALETEELIKIVNAPWEYSSEAIETATSELRRRNISPQNLLSSNPLSNIDLVKIALETDREDVVAAILPEFKKRNIWENVTHSLQTELGYSTNKMLDEVVPEGIWFTEKFKNLLTIDPLGLTKNEPIDIILMIYRHLAKDIVAGKEEEIFHRLRVIGVNAYLTLQIIEPFYHRVKSLLPKQKPNFQSYIYALFAGLLSTIIGGVGYGYFMITTNFKLNYVLILLGVLSGVLINILTGGKKGIGMILIGVSSTVLSILLGNLIFAINKSVPLRLTGFDFMWGIAGLFAVVSLSRMIKTKSKK
jgi:hypothetical protein